MKAWQYTDTTGGLEKNLELTEVARPAEPVGEFEILVEVISASINPADHKVPELGLISRSVIRRPATPGMDFSGRVVSLGAKIDSFSIGETVFGRLAPKQHGSLGQLIVVDTKNEACVALPAGVDVDHAATVGTAGITAYEAIAPNVKSGDKVFINGGSGGTGTFGIQIAKALGCYVTVTCSSGKAQLCKTLGADEIIDYTTTNVAQKLKEAGQVYSLAVDNVGSPPELYKAADDFLLPSGQFVQIGSSVSVESAKSVASRLLLPSFLGGGKRKFSLHVIKPKQDELRQLGRLMVEGKVKPAIDEVFKFEDAPRAFEKLKQGKVAGKIVIHVTNKETS